MALRNEGFTITRHRDGTAAKNYEARVSILNRDQTMKLGIVKLNQPLTYQGMNIYLQGYNGSEGQHEITLLVGRDPGYGLVIAAGFLLLVGIVVTLYFPSASIYARLEPPGILHLAGWTERRACDFEREFSALVERIKYSSIAETERTS
jgi:cytochrome c biogenesis protein ResB